ncbi:MAG: pyridoxal phosphate-dependent aminotransferase [Puniceicoccales bacterium]|jgi:aspartate aminotransferase|nr:pyridoxal phosphate-dependent aminotransferase [Puniceicoccales bacterium]
MSETTTNVLSTWARNVAPSPTLAVDAKAKALKAAGKDVCSFGTGEPDFDTPEFVKEAAAKALAEGQTKYTPTPGIPALRKAIAESYNAQGFAISAEQVVVSPGGKMSCYLAILATVSPGDEVIIPAPYWVSYPEMVKLAGGVPKFVTSTDADGFKITPEKLRAALTPRSKLLILNSPSNPTGAIYSEVELRALTAAALDAGLLILSDEIYEHLVYDGRCSFHPALFSTEAAERVITASGFAKTYSMTGWRLGTTVASPKIAAAIADLQSQTTSNVTTFAQYGALAVYQQPEAARAALAEMLGHFDRRRQKLLAALNAIQGMSCHRSQGAFYLFPNIAAFGLSSAEFCGRLLEEELVAAVPGSAFGSEGYLRLSYATADETIEKGAARLAEFCRRLRG